MLGWQSYWYLHSKSRVHFVVFIFVGQGCTVVVAEGLETTLPCKS